MIGYRSYICSVSSLWGNKWRLTLAQFKWFIQQSEDKFINTAYDIEANSSQLGASESWLWHTYHHVHLWHIITYINSYILVFTSPFLNSGAWNNIFHIKQYLSSNIRVPPSTVQHRLTSSRRLHRASLIWDIAEVPYIFGRRHSPGISAHV